MPRKFNLQLCSCTTFTAGPAQCTLLYLILCLLTVTIVNYPSNTDNVTSCKFVHFTLGMLFNKQSKVKALTKISRPNNLLFFFLVSPTFS